MDVLTNLLRLADNATVSEVAITLVQNGGREDVCSAILALAHKNDELMALAMRMLDDDRTIADSTVASSQHTETSSVTVEVSATGASVGPTTTHYTAAPTFVISNPHKLDVIDYNALVLSDRLGTGGFGEVFEATFELNRVAVKIMHSVRPNRVQPFIDECSVLATLHHRNCVMFVGACIDPKFPLCIVTELMSGGTLTPAPGMPYSTILHALYDVTNGLAYLSRKDIVHRDIKPENILCNRAKDCYKISDFGISKCLTVDEAYGHAGTVRYTSPEVLGSGRCTMMGDIYSLGVVTWELMTGGQPRPFEGVDRKRNLTVTCGPVSDTWPQSMRQLIEQCNTYNPEKRPDVLMIMEKLSSMRRDLQSAHSVAEFPLHELCKAAAEPTDIMCTLALDGLLNHFDKNKYTPLHYASACGHTAVIRALLKLGALHVHTDDQECLTPLHLAAQHGHVEAVSALLEGGVDPSPVDHLLMTPLHDACANGHVGVVRALLEAGADPAALDKGRLTALQHAVREHHTEVISLWTTLVAPIQTPTSASLFPPVELESPPPSTGSKYLVFPKSPSKGSARPSNDFLALSAKEQTRSGEAFWAAHFGDASTVTAFTLLQVLKECGNDKMEGVVKLLDPDSRGNVSREHFLLFLSWFGPPEQCVANAEALMANGWFHGWLAKDIAVQMLASCPEGTFLARLSESSPGCFVIVYMSAYQQIYQCKISFTRGKGYSADDNQSFFASLPELVQGHSQMLFLPKARSAGYGGYSALARGRS